MELDRVLEGLYQNGMVPVIAIDNAGDAVPLAKAILAGGLDAAEITFRTPAAAEVPLSSPRVFAVIQMTLEGFSRI